MPTRLKDMTEDNVPWRLADHVQLRAVLVPLTGKYQFRSEIPRRTLRIKMRWKTVVNGLYEANVCGYAGYSAIRCHGLCPPTFVMGADAEWHHPCGARVSCPWCWARQAGQVWAKVDRAFFAGVPTPAGGGRAGRVIELDGRPPDEPPPGPRQSGAAVATGRVLATRVYRIETPSLVVQDPPLPPLDPLRDFYESRVRRGGGVAAPAAVPCRADEVRATVACLRRGAAYGCFENILADLASGRPRRWRIRVVQVWMLPAGSLLSIIAGSGLGPPRDTYVEEPSRTKVMAAVAAACRYPRAMFGGVPLARQLIESRRGLRLSALHGAFRKPHGRE
jgi:hypothetical protein